jgi:hypothetical protein
MQLRRRDVVGCMAAFAVVFVLYRMLFSTRLLSGGGGEETNVDMLVASSFGTALANVPPGGRFEPIQEEKNADMLVASSFGTALTNVPTRAPIPVPTRAPIPVPTSAPTRAPSGPPKTGRRKKLKNVMGNVTFPKQAQPGKRHRWKAKSNHHKRHKNTGEAVRVAHEKRMTEIGKGLRRYKRVIDEQREKEDLMSRSAEMTAAGLFSDDDEGASLQRRHGTKHAESGEDEASSGARGWQQW